MAGLRTGLTLLAPQHFCFQPIGEKKKKKPQDFAASVEYCYSNRAGGDLL